MPSNSSTNALVGGLLFAGLAVASGGSSVAVSLAWLVGSTVGSLLSVEDTANTQEGPRQTEFRTTASKYGTPIPRGYGTARLGGNIVWASRVTEREVRETTCIKNPGIFGSNLGASRSCQTVVTYRYTQSWFTVLCEGPVGGVTRVWADGKLIFDLTGIGETAAQFVQEEEDIPPRPIIRLIKGTFDQEPDPHIKRLQREDAEQTTEETPAYQGLAGLLFINADLEQWGYRIPNVNAEIHFDVEPPTRCRLVSDMFFAPVPPIPNFALQMVDQDGIMVFFTPNPDTNRLEMRAIQAQSGTQFFSRPAPWADYTVSTQVLCMGTDNTVYVAVFFEEEGRNNQVHRFRIYTSELIARYDCGAMSPVNAYENAVTGELIIASRNGRFGIVPTDESSESPLSRGRRVDDGSGGFFADNTVGSIPFTAFDTFHLDALVELATDVIYVNQDSAPAIAIALSFAPSTTHQGVAAPVVLQILAPDLARSIVVVDPMTGRPVSATNGALLYDPIDNSCNVILNNFQGTLGDDDNNNMFKLDIDTLTFTLSGRAPYDIVEFGVDPQLKQGAFNGIFEYSFNNTLYRLDMIDLSVVETVARGEFWPDCAGLIGSRSVFLPESNSTLFLLGANLSYIGYYNTEAREISVQKVFNDQVLTDHNRDRFGIDESDLDTDELASEVINGIVYRNQQPIRGNLAPLQQGFFFDYFESDGMIKARLRRQRDVTAIIPNYELSAREGGSDSTSRITITRTPELELPREVTVNYTSIELDYEQGSERATKDTTDATARITVTLPIVMSAEQAKQIAEALLHTAWIERTNYNIAVPPKYMFIEVGDSIDVESEGITYNMRVTRQAVGANGMVLLDGSAEDIARFDIVALSQRAVGLNFDELLGNSSYIVRAVEIPLKGISSLKNNTPVVALAGIASGAAPLPDIRIRRTDDRGEHHVGRIQNTTIGGALEPDSNVLGPINGPLSAVDWTTPIMVRISNTAELQNATLAELQAGANYALIGAEIVQFMEAVELDSDTWQLNGFLRGQNNTFPQTKRHLPGEPFLLLQNLLFDSNFVGSEGDSVFYAFESGPYRQREGAILDGASVRPYAVGNLSAVPVGDIATQFTWTRNTRFDSDEVGEESEFFEIYEFRVFTVNDAGNLVLRDTVRIRNEREYNYFDGIVEDGVFTPFYTDPVIFEVAQIGNFDLDGTPTQFRIGHGDSIPSQLLVADFVPGGAPDTTTMWPETATSNWSVITNGLPVSHGGAVLAHNANAVSGDTFERLRNGQGFTDCQVDMRFTRDANSGGEDQLATRMVLRANEAPLGGSIEMFGLVVAINGDGTQIRVVTYEGPSGTTEVARIPIPVIQIGQLHALKVEVYCQRIRLKIWRPEVETEPAWLYRSVEDIPNLPLAGAVGFGAENGDLGDRVIQMMVGYNGKQL